MATKYKSTVNYFLVATICSLGFLIVRVYNSTEIAFALLTQLPRAQIPVLQRFFSFLLSSWTVQRLIPSGACKGFCKYS